MKKIFSSLVVLSVLVTGCTKLNEGVYDQQVASDFYATPVGINSALADLYGEMRGDWGGKGIAGADRGWYDLNETCTDEMMLPTRSNGAWDDNGIWRQMYLHQWTESQEFIGNTWNWLYRAVTKSNLAVRLLTDANAAPTRIAEAKVLRAYFYYMLMDGWGNIPFYTTNNLTPDKIPQTNRKVIYDFVESELKANVGLLSETIDGEYYGRFNKWAGFAFLAKLYLNAGVYTGTPKWSEAVAASDSVIKGGFDLVPNYFDAFGDRCNSKETLLAIFINANTAPRNIIGIRTLAGQQGQAMFGIDTWNGATAHQDFVNKYANNDARKAQWLVGAQPGGISYDLNIASLTNAGVLEGARNSKFLPVLPLAGNGSASNDFPIFRFSDVLLTKAEALLRVNGSTAEAKNLYDRVRNRAGLPVSTAAPTLTDIYDERGRELCWEGHRRQDMIRFGTFLKAHDFKTVSPGEATRTIFPIPTNALATNPNLKQNPGY
jgi:starch-binding outer membrane protein, SusD/RagB family